MYLEVVYVRAFSKRVATAANKIWKRIEASAEKRNINLRLFVFLYSLGIVIFYYGAFVLATRDFFLGLAIMAGSYFFDYGYIFVFGKPDKKMLYWVAALGLVAAISLSIKVGPTWALLTIAYTATVIAIARALRKKSKS